MYEDDNRTRISQHKACISAWCTLVKMLWNLLHFSIEYYWPTLIVNGWAYVTGLCLSVFCATHVLWLNGMFYRKTAWRRILGFGYPVHGRYLDPVGLRTAIPLNGGRPYCLRLQTFALQIAAKPLLLAACLGLLLTAYRNWPTPHLTVQSPTAK